MMASAAAQPRIVRRRRIDRQRGILERDLTIRGRAGVRKVPFTVPQPDEDVPAIMWLPERPQRRRPLVLLGHGGGHAQGIPATSTGSGTGWRAVTASAASPLTCHFTVSAPRPRRSGCPRSSAAAGWALRLAGAQRGGDRAGGGRLAGGHGRGAGARPTMPHGPVGYFGVSMGTRFGVPLIAAEPRIAAAVLGLFGVPAADTESAFARAARQVTVPVLFLQQLGRPAVPGRRRPHALQPARIGGQDAARQSGRAPGHPTVGVRSRGPVPPPITSAAATAIRVEIVVTDYVRRVPSPGDGRWASVGLDV